MRTLRTLFIVAAALALAGCSGDPYRIHVEGENVRAELYRGRERLGGVGPVSGSIDWTQGEGIKVTPRLP